MVIFNSYVKLPEGIQSVIDMISSNESPPGPPSYAGLTFKCAIMGRACQGPMWRLVKPVSQTMERHKDGELAKVITWFEVEMKCCCFYFLANRMKMKFRNSVSQLVPKHEAALQNRQPRTADPELPQYILVEMNGHGFPNRHFIVFFMLFLNMSSIVNPKTSPTHQIVRILFSVSLCGDIA